ncbi:MAG: hypothetical protein ACOXZQ_03060 [Bacteroidales bacterium]|jgi:hypothetical protein
MAIRFSIILTLCCLGFPIYSQVNISFDNDCTKKNSAVFALTLIENLGENKVVELLEKDVTLLTTWETDSIGRINGFRLISKKELSKSLLDSIETFLIKNSKRFFSCYVQLPGYDNSDSYKIIINNLSENKEGLFVNAAFPGELMTFYNYEVVEKRHGKLSKYRYLQKQIKRYLPLSP